MLLWPGAQCLWAAGSGELCPSGCRSECSLLQQECSHRVAVLGTCWPLLQPLEVRVGWSVVYHWGCGRGLAPSAAVARDKGIATVLAAEAGPCPRLWGCSQRRWEVGAAVPGEFPEQPPSASFFVVVFEKIPPIQACYSKQVPGLLHSPILLLDWGLTGSGSVTTQLIPAICSLRGCVTEQT